MYNTFNDTRKASDCLSSFLCFFLKRKKIIQVYFHGWYIGETIVITGFVNQLFFLGKSKEGNMTKNRKNCCCKMKINKVY